MTYDRLFNIIDGRLRYGRTLKSCKYLLENHPLRNTFFRIDYAKQYLDSPKYITNQYGYKRIPIYKSSILEMHLIKWGVDSISPVHAHPEYGCLMKIISGQLKENQYRSINRTHLNQPSLTKIDMNILTNGLVHYIPGGDVCHKITNDNGTGSSVSLHFYAPPYDIDKLE